MKNKWSIFIVLFILIVTFLSTDLLVRNPKGEFLFDIKNDMASLNFDIEDIATDNQDNLYFSDTDKTIIYDLNNLTKREIDKKDLDTTKLNYYSKEKIKSVNNKPGGWGVGSYYDETEGVIMHSITTFFQNSDTGKVCSIDNSTCFSFDYMIDIDFISGTYFDVKLFPQIHMIKDGKEKLIYRKRTRNISVPIITNQNKIILVDDHKLYRLDN